MTLDAFYGIPAPGKEILGPSGRAFTITPSDSDDLAKITRGIYVGTTGDLKVTMAHDGTTLSFVGLAAGIIHPLAVRKVFATGQPGTIAANIVGIL